jgi:hypothetical protein
MDLESPVPAWRKVKASDWVTCAQEPRKSMGKLDIQTAAGHGTSIVLTVPIPL